MRTQLLWLMAKNNLMRVSWNPVPLDCRRVQTRRRGRTTPLDRVSRCFLQNSMIHSPKSILKSLLENIPESLLFSPREITTKCAISLSSKTILTSSSKLAKNLLPSFQEMILIYFLPPTRLPKIMILLISIVWV